MQEAMKLCDVTCADGSMYSFFACVKGHLIEVNKRLADDPTLLQRKVMWVGVLLLFFHLLLAGDWMFSRHARKDTSPSSSLNGQNKRPLVVIYLRIARSCRSGSEPARFLPPPAMLLRTHHPKSSRHEPKDFVFTQIFDPMHDGTGLFRT